MNKEQGSRNVPRSIGAVVAGIVVGAALSILTDILLRSGGNLSRFGSAHGGFVSGARDRVSLRLQRARGVRDGSFGAESAYVPRAGRRSHWDRGGYDRCDCDLERRPAIWASLVSDRVDCARAPNRVGRRTDSRDANRECEKQCCQRGVKRWGCFNAR